MSIHFTLLLFITYLSPFTTMFSSFDTFCSRKLIVNYILSKDINIVIITICNKFSNIRCYLTNTNTNTNKNGYHIGAHNNDSQYIY